MRATWVEVSPDQIDRGIDFYKTTILPALEELDGFCSASLLLDRASGRAVASATFDSVEAKERNKDRLERLRGTGSQEVAAEVLDECDFELAVAHLRVNWVGRTARGPLGGSFSVRPPAEPDWPVSEHPALR